MFSVITLKATLMTPTQSLSSPSHSHSRHPHTFTLVTLTHSLSSPSHSHSHHPHTVTPSPSPSPSHHPPLSPQSLKQYNKSAIHYYQCHEVQPSFAAALSQYKAALCELKIKKMLENHAKELTLARVKLDDFYKKHDEMQRHQQFEDLVPQPPLGW